MCAKRAHLRVDATLLEERPRGLLHELDAHHLVAAIGQPGEVVALAAQRDQHPRRRLGQLAGVGGKQAVDVGQMEADLSVAPAFRPVSRVHHPRKLAPAGRRATPGAVYFASAGSTVSR